MFIADTFYIDTRHPENSQDDLRTMQDAMRRELEGAASEAQSMLVSGPQFMVLVFRSGLESAEAPRRATPFLSLAHPSLPPTHMTPDDL